MRVGLFPTCLVDLFRPAVGFAAARLLTRAGCEVDAVTSAVCCGQPAYNSGNRPLAQALARRVVAACEGFDHIVVPSGSCAGMIRRHYPDLLADDPAWAARATAVAAKSWELVSFLCDVLGVEAIDGQLTSAATYHDSCSGLRELSVKQQPRRLLAGIAGLRLVELENAETCCGFGGTFCVKFPEIADRMASDKCAAITASDADLLLAGDLGCLMHMAGKLSRLGTRIEVRHIAEVLDGALEEPGLCSAEEPA